MKAIVIGSGMAGLTAAAYLCRAGHEVHVFEQHHEIGGVTATMYQGGFGWDLGPLLLEGFGPDDMGTKILKEIGAGDRVRTVREDRGIVFPDFSLWKPAEFQGTFWRKDLLGSIFPGEREGLDRYYRFYGRMMKILAAVRQSEKLSELQSIIPKLKAWCMLQSLRRYLHLPASRVMNEFFSSPKLQAVYTAILADIVTKPSQFPSLGVPVFNQEPAFDKRTPLDALQSEGVGYYYILGGCGKLVEAAASSVAKHGGKIHTKAPVQKIIIENGRATGVLLSDGSLVSADIILATGGARETFHRLVGAFHLPSSFMKSLSELQYMESVLMVQLGIDFDPSPYQPAALCYYYGTYDIEGGVDRCLKGEYHEGNDGFLIYIPSMHSPELAPPGQHSVTIYTIAPNILSKGTWEGRREELSEKLITGAEKYIPGLRRGIRLKVVLTPVDFCNRIFQDRHAFGGIAPVMDKKNPPHRSPVKGLWFLGSQSESGGGVLGVMKGARNVARMIDHRVKAFRA